jgi:ABC-type oligopeptide transport system ATPase subunit
MTTPALQVRNLVKVFGRGKSLLHPDTRLLAVDDVSFEVPQGQTLALVGESGSGKSTVGLMALGLLAPTSGQVLFEGRDFVDIEPSQRRAMRRKMQVVFQDPFGSLNGRMTIREAVTEGMIIHRLCANATEREERAAKLLADVGMERDTLDRYPHEFSGGQRQRIAIARALSVEPTFMVLDEPTSALDVSVQSQVLNLLRKLQQERGLAFLFITHNLAVVEYLADEVCVMSRGRIVERGTVERIFDSPEQEYTKKLLSSIPSTDPDARRLTTTA